MTIADNNAFLRQIISEAPAETKEKLQALSVGETIVADVDSAVFGPGLRNNPYAVFCLLLEEGYLTVTEKLSCGFCRLKIPNKEVQHFFATLL